MTAAASISSRLIAEVVAKGVAPLLKSNGFRKQRHHFFRECSQATCHLIVQSSQWNSPTRASFTINLRSYLPAIALARGELPVREPLRQRLGHCAIRIGHLLPDPGDYWWGVTGRSDVDRIAYEVSSAIERFALPYLNRIATLEGVAELSGHIPGICTQPTDYKVIALRLLGREHEAAEVERALEAQRQASRARIQGLGAQVP